MCHTARGSRPWAVVRTPRDDSNLQVQPAAPISPEAHSNLRGRARHRLRRLRQTVTPLPPTTPKDRSASARPRRSPSPAAATPSPAAIGRRASRSRATCPTRSLSAKIGGLAGTAVQAPIPCDRTSTNISQCSAATCNGIPRGVSLAGGTPGQQIGLAAPPSSHATARVLVKLNAGGGRPAHFCKIVHDGNYPASRCGNGPRRAPYIDLPAEPDHADLPQLLTRRPAPKPVQIMTVSVVEPGSGSA